MILLDYDCKKGAVRELGMRLRTYEHILGVKCRVLEAWETKHGYHFYLMADVPEYCSVCHYWDKISMDFEREVHYIVMQLALGSDYKRELYNLRNAMKNPGGHNNVLFRSTEVRRDRVAEVLLNSGLWWI